MKKWIAFTLVTMACICFLVFVLPHSTLAHIIHSGFTHQKTVIIGAETLVLLTLLGYSLWYTRQTFNDNTIESQELFARYFFIFASAFAILAVVAITVAVPSGSLFIQRLGYLLVLAFAALALGALFGFLFGVPKQVASANTALSDTERYTGNTNLEQISDWLTKILVGAGLVSLTKIPRKLTEVGAYSAEYLSKSAGWEAQASMCLGIEVCFCIFGFFLSYLFARIYLPKALESVQNRAIEQAIQKRALG